MLKGQPHETNTKKGAPSSGIMLWYFYENEWYFVAQVRNSNYTILHLDYRMTISVSQVSVSSTKLNDVKIDPLRGQRSHHEETWEQTAAREVFEESSHLFDLRSPELIRDILPESKRTGNSSGTIYHIAIVFEDSLSQAISPAQLVKEYRENRRNLMKNAGMIHMKARK